MTHDNVRGDETSNPHPEGTCGFTPTESSTPLPISHNFPEKSSGRVEMASDTTQRNDEAVTIAHRGSITRSLGDWWAWWKTGQSWSRWNEVSRSTAVWFAVLFGSLLIMASIVAGFRPEQYNQALTTGLRVNAITIQVGAAVWSVFGVVWTVVAVLFRSRLSRALDRPLVTFPFPEGRVLRRRARMHAIKRATEPFLVPLAWYAVSLP
jgi:hypothetical protein